MAYSKLLATTIPVEPDADLDLLRWLTRESFERTAAAEYLRLTDYTETEVPWEDIPPKVGKQLGAPVEHFQWFRFSATAVRDAQSI